MTTLAPHLVNGIALGLLFALLALGFMLIVGLMETINLAHGSFFALGAYVALMIVAPPLPAETAAGWLALPLAVRYGIALVLAPAMVGVLGMVSRTRAAPNVRQGSTVCIVVDLWRGDRDRRSDSRDMGLARARLADAGRAARLGRDRRPAVCALSLLRRGRRCAGDRRALAFYRTHFVSARRSRRVRTTAK